MTERIAYLEAVVGADITSFRRGMQEVRRETGVLSDTLGGIGHVGRSMTLAITAPLAALAVGSVKAAAGFDASMRNINSIAFLTEENLAGLAARTLEFGASIRSGPQAASEALYTVFSAGITDVETAFNIMEVGAKTAEAGLASLTTTTEGLVATALTFGDQSAAAMNKYSDATTLAVQLGVGSMDTFNTAFANSMGSAAAVGSTFEDMSATIAYLSQRGLNAASAGTMLNNVYTKLMKPGEELDAIFTKLGMSSGKDLITTFGGLEGGLRAIYGLVGKDETVWAKLFPDARGFKAVSRIFTAFEEDGTDAVSAFFTAFDEKMAAGGVTMAAWEQQMMSFEAQWGLLTSAVSGFAITIGNILLPILTPVVQGFTAFINNLSATSPELLKVGVAVAALVAVAGPLLWLIGSLVSPFALVIAAAGGLAVAFATNFGDIRTSAEKLVTDVLGPLDGIKTGIDTFINTLFGGGEAVNPNEGLFPTVTINPQDFIQINPDGQAISLWSYFEGEGFIEKFSWDEFQKMAYDAGWNGEAIKPGDVLTLLTPSTGGGSAALDWWGDLFKVSKPGPIDIADWGFTGGQEDTSIGGKIAAAFSAAWPLIQTALTDIGTNFVTWVDGTLIPDIDTAASGVLDSLGKMFNPVGTTGDGDTGIFSSIRNIFQGDLTDVAASIGGWFQEKFPEISRELGIFMESIGSWLLNEGVPTVARSIGYFGGQLVGLFNSAISGAFSFITGGGEGPNAGDVAKDVQNAVLSPLSAGFQDALADQGIAAGSADSFFTNLEAMLLGAAILWSPAATLGTTIMGKVTGAIASAKVTGTQLSAVWTGISGVLTGLLPRGGILDDVALRGMFAVDNIKTALGTAVSGAASLLSVAAPIVLPALAIVAGVAALAMVFDEKARGDAKIAISNFIDGIFGDGTTDGFISDFSTRFTAFIGTVAASLGRTDIAGAAAATGGSEVAKQMIDGYLSNFVRSSARNLSQYEILKLGGFDDATIALAGYQVAGDFMTAFTTGIQNTANNAMIENSIGAQEFNLNAGGTASTFVNSLNNAVIAPEDLATFSTNMGGAIQGAIAAGEFDGQALVDKLIVPLATGFTTHFGLEAPATLAWAGFIEGIKTGQATVTEKFTLISQDISLLMADAVNNMPTIKTAIIGAMNLIALSISSVDLAAKSLANTLNGLNGSTISFTTTVSGGGMPIGGNASGGSAEGFRMVGERGPELVHFGQQGQVMPTRMLRDFGSGSGGGDSVTIYVDGVSDVDSFLFEIERRGYTITR